MSQLDSTATEGNQPKSPTGESLRIFAFPKGPQFWRIDWLGDVSFPDRSTRRTQPSVFVHLSKVVDPRFPADPSVLLSPASTSPAKFQKRIWVSIGTLPLLRVGDIWRDGELVYRPDYQLERFENIEINQQTSSLIKAGLNPEEHGFLLPLSEHPWHMNCTHSYCLMVDLPGGGPKRRLIIPCMELIRFYFGSSSSLITKLFLPPLNRKELYSEAQHDPGSGHLHLQLAPRIPGVSAVDIGRMHLSHQAWRAAVLVGTSILKASTTQQPIYPQAIFPFEGKTSLTIAGKWLSFEGQKNATFLAYSLQSCDYPLPFDSLRYEVSDSRPKAPRQQGNSPHDDTSSGNESDKRFMAESTGDNNLKERDPSSQLAPRTQTYREPPKFTDMIPKQVWRTRSLQPKELMEFMRSKRKSTHFGALGEAGSTDNVRQIELAQLSQYETDDIGFSSQFLKDLVLELQTLEGAEVTLLTANEQNGWSVPVTILSNDDGEIFPQLFIDGMDGHQRLRRAIVFGLRQAFTLERKSSLLLTCLVLVEPGDAFARIYPATGDPGVDLPAALSQASAGVLKEDDGAIPTLQELLGHLQSIARLQ